MLGFFVWITRFFIWNNTSVLPKYEKWKCKCVHAHVIWLAPLFHVDAIILDDPTLLISVHITCMPPSYEKVKKQEICILLTQLKELQRKRATYRFPPWNQFHLCRNCSKGNEKSSFSYSFAYIVELFSILLITKYCTNLNTLNSTSNLLHRKFTSS